MPRQARLDAPGTLHHLIGRGIEGGQIFRSDFDRADFLTRVEDLCREAAASEKHEKASYGLCGQF